MGKKNGRKPSNGGQHETACNGSGHNKNNKEDPRLRLAIFDLDYTIWQPEMHMLRGPPVLTALAFHKQLSKLQDSDGNAPLGYRTDQKGMILTDRNQEAMQVFDGASYALREIEQWKRSGVDIQAAVASKTDDPAWAQTCLNHLVIDAVPGTRLVDCFGPNLIEISYGSKVNHIQRLHQKTDIPYEQMAFFDNERWNITDVRRGLPAVKSYYTPNGMSRKVWNQAKVDFKLAGTASDSSIHDDDQSEQEIS